jgi:T5orf172 domain
MANLESKGYVYCMSNIAMPGIYKIGFTCDPNRRLNEANVQGTYGLPYDYTYLCVKSVSDMKAKEKTLHRVLKGTRIRDDREFFKVDASQVELLFDLMDGERWIKPELGTKADLDDDLESVGSSQSRLPESFFTNGQKVRHMIGDHRPLIAIYDKDAGCLYHDGKRYTSGELARYHARLLDKQPSRKALRHQYQIQSEDGSWSKLEEK